jgi:hypothetical protein
MVVCLSCKKMVWAYDADMGPVRGILNMMKMPCRLCGAKGNFDGWRVNDEIIIHLHCPDPWAAMRKIAEAHGFEWANSPDCVWFTEEHSPQAR